MDLRPTEAEEKFRHELRSWLSESVPAHGEPPPRQDWPARRAWDTGWQRKMYDAGWAGISWPKAFGGREASLIEQLIYYEEYARAKAPYVGVNFVGLLHGGPTLIVEGTDAQKEKHIPYILRGEQVWCQGFSEPSAGSDLASLRTRAERDGDHYVVNGHKIWTSFAQVADYCELLVRTDPNVSKHGGISWLIMPMDLPGIEVRPLPTLHGEGEFSEVFLDNVRIPVENLVGAENDGWRVTNVTLRFERGTAFAGEMYDLKRWLSEIAAEAQKVTDHGTRAWDDAALRREIGHLRAEVDSLWNMLKLSIGQADESGVPGIGASAVKLFFTELKQKVGDIAMRVLGRAVLGRSDMAGMPVQYFSYEALQSLSMTIAAGSSQIQRKIIGERILGLPKDK